MTGPQKLFSPINIGSMQLKNRLVMAPMTTNYGTSDQEPSPRLLEYLEARARGGVGLITVEVCTVDSKHRYQTNSMSLGEDRYVEQHKKLLEVIHRHGAKAQPQITHPGPESMSMWVENIDAVGASPVCGLGNRPPCRELAEEELEGIIDQYAQAARRAKEAGYDGMELHAAHAYMLLASFLSPWRNKRRDGYGKRSGRARLLLEVIQRMKQSTGGDFPLTLRISGFERLKGGREINDTQELAQGLVEAGVDAFHLTGGYAGDHEASMTICGSDIADGYNVAQAQALKQVVDVPVMVVGRIHDPRLAEEILQNEQADIIVMGRPLLADPELPNKALQGRYEDIRRCISCQNCIDTLALSDMNCAVNACSGREMELKIEPAETIKTVLVVGTGAAGMEAARVAALRGHRVILCDKAKRLGGSLTLASAVHKDNEHFLRFLLTQMKALPIDIRLGQEVTPDFVRSISPAAVIVATGAKVHNIAVPGNNLSHVYSGSQLRAILAGEINNDLAGRTLPGWMSSLLKMAGPVLQRVITPALLRRASQLWMPVGKKVVIVGADLAALELAEFMAKRGRKVCLIDEGDRLAPEVGVRRRSDHMDRLDELSVVINTNITVKRITQQGVLIENKMAVEHLVQGDTVILAGEPVADTSLYDALKTVVPEVYAIGDCTGMGLIAGATTDAMRVATAL